MGCSSSKELDAQLKDNFFGEDHANKNKNNDVSKNEIIEAMTNTNNYGSSSHIEIFMRKGCSVPNDKKASNQVCSYHTDILLDQVEIGAMEIGARRARRRGGTGVEHGGGFVGDGGGGFVGGGGDFGGGGGGFVGGGDGGDCGGGGGGGGDCGGGGD